MTRPRGSADGRSRGPSGPAAEAEGRRERVEQGSCPSLDGVSRRAITKRAVLSAESLIRCLPGVVVAVALVVALAAGCGGGRSTRASTVRFGDAESGRDAIKSYGCGSCHRIPGVAGADADVGPPLTRFGRRSFIAGELANTPDNLVRWVMDPQGVEQGTAMPNLGVSHQDAENITAYLEGL